MRFKVEMEVEVNDDPEHGCVTVNDAGEIDYCNGCGDSYGSSLDFFQHQLERDLQFIYPDLKTIKVEEIRATPGSQALLVLEKLGRP